MISYKEEIDSNIVSLIAQKLRESPGAVLFNLIKSEVWGGLPVKVEKHIRVFTQGYLNDKFEPKD